MPPAVAAVLIGSAVTGGAALGAAKIQSNAAGKAQKAQQAGTDKALQVQQQASAPYTALGQQSAARLAARQPEPYTQQFRPGQPGNGFQAPQGMPQQGPGGPPPTLGSIGMPQPSMVTLQAPDGSTRQFPTGDAQRIIQQARAAGHELRQV